jgi:hypothetical protein
MVMEAKEMERKGREKVEEEMREAEEEIDGDRFDAQDAIPLQRLEEGEVVPSSPNARKQKKLGWVSRKARGIFAVLSLSLFSCSPLCLLSLGSGGIGVRLLQLL